MREETKDLLLELIEDTIKPALAEIPLRSLGEVREALEYLAEEIEGIESKDVYNDIEMLDSSDVEY